LFDKIFPKYSDTFPDLDAPEGYLIMQVAKFVENQSRQIELFYLPFLLQKADLTDVTKLPLENQIPVVSMKRRFYVAWAWQSRYIFYACVGANLVWGTFWGIQILIITWPKSDIDRSALSEVDFVHAPLALPYESAKRLAQAHRSLDTLETKEIAAATRHLRIRVAIATEDGREGEFSISAI
jgi:hypothetical protein